MRTTLNNQWTTVGVASSEEYKGSPEAEYPTRECAWGCGFWVSWTVATTRRTTAMTRPAERVWSHDGGRVELQQARERRKEVRRSEREPTLDVRWSEERWAAMDSV